jgi:glutamyl-tRNA reductase
MPVRRNRPLFLVDIAVPRDIDSDVQELPNVFLYNVDHLEAIVRENVRTREQELSRCNSIIQERAAALLERFSPAPTTKPQLSDRLAPSGWVLSGVAACHG